MRIRQAESGYISSQYFFFQDRIILTIWPLLWSIYLKLILTFKHGNAIQGKDSLGLILQFSFWRLFQNLCADYYFFPSISIVAGKLLCQPYFSIVNLIKLH